MLEVRTIDLDRNVFEHFMSNVRQLDYYDPVEKGRQSISITRDTLPSLAHCTFRGRSSVGVEHKGPFDLEVFWRLLDTGDEILMGSKDGAATNKAKKAKPMPSETLLLTTTVGLSESGRAFDPETQSDFDLRFEGRTAYGPGIAATLGDVTPAREDLAYRKRLFNDFIAGLGLSDSMNVTLHSGRIYLEVSDPDILYLSNLPKSERRRVKDWVLPALRQESDDAPHRLVFMHTAAATKTEECSNFTDLIVYGYDLQALRSSAEDVLTFFGGRDEIRWQSLRASPSPPQYEKLRGPLHETGLSPWEITYRAEVQYAPDDIDALTEGHEYVGGPLFWLDPPGIGPVGADFNYEEGRFSLTFTCEFESNEQEAALHELIGNLAGGRDIIDHALT